MRPITSNVIDSYTKKYRSTTAEVQVRKTTINNREYYFFTAEIVQQRPLIVMPDYEPGDIITNKLSVTGRFAEPLAIAERAEGAHLFEHDVECLLRHINDYEDCLI